MFVGICKLNLYLPESDSLKSKRQIIRKIKDRVDSKFKVSIAEVGDLDLWQRCELGISFVGNDHSFVNSVMDNVTRFIEGMMVAQLLDRHLEILSI